MGTPQSLMQQLRLLNSLLLIGDQLSHLALMKRVFRGEKKRSVLPFRCVFSHFITVELASGQVLEAGPGPKAALGNVIIFLWDCHTQ